MQPTDNGPIDAFAGVLAGLLEAVDARRFTLGRDDLTVAALVAAVLARPAEPFLRRHGRSLDEYLEAQLHGPLLLSRDVELLVCDPSFRATPCDEVLQALAARHAIPLAWHQGFRLAFTSIDAEFRGPAVRCCASTPF